MTKFQVFKVGWEPCVISVGLSYCKSGLSSEAGLSSHFTVYFYSILSKVHNPTLHKITIKEIHNNAQYTLNRTQGKQMHNILIIKLFIWTIHKIIITNYDNSFINVHINVAFNKRWRTPLDKNTPVGNCILTLMQWTAF